MKPAASNACFHQLAPSNKAVRIGSGAELSMWKTIGSRTRDRGAAGSILSSL